MKVLLSAEACDPDGSSEAGVGWAFARAAAQRHDVWLLTNATSAPTIERARRELGLVRLHPVYVGGWLTQSRDNRIARQAAYVQWQRAAGRRAQQLQRTERFDVAHHVSWATDFLPIGIARTGLPLVVGPIGGSASVPPGLRRWLGWRGGLRRSVTAPLIRLTRFLLADRALRRADVVVALNGHVAARYPGRSFVEPNAAIDAEQLRSVPRRDREPHLAVYAGRLVAWKGIQLAIAAVAKTPDWRLEVIGPGPERRRAEARARRLGIVERVSFAGWQPRTETLARIARAHCLLAPSLLDAAPWTVAEAVALGTPAVVLDWLGSAEIVAGTASIAVPADRHAPEALGRALERVPCGMEPSLRWRGDRLGELLDGWYAGAVRQASRTRSR